MINAPTFSQLNMTEQNLPVLVNLPSAVVNDVGSYGLIEFETIELATSLANRAFKRIDEVAQSPDTHDSLRAAVNNLSDAISAISGQLMQLEHGIKTGRIAVARHQ